MIKNTYIYLLIYHLPCIFHPNPSSPIYTSPVPSLRKEKPHVRQAKKLSMPIYASKSKNNANANANANAPDTPKPRCAIQGFSSVNLNQNKPERIQKKRAKTPVVVTFVIRIQQRKDATTSEEKTQYPKDSPGLGPAMQTLPQTMPSLHPTSRIDIPVKNPHST